MSAPVQTDDPYWSVERIADYFAVKKATVVRWIHEGEFGEPGNGFVGKINNRWKVRQSAVYRYRDEKFGANK